MSDDAHISLAWAAQFVTIKPKQGPPAFYSSHSYRLWLKGFIDLATVTHTRGSLVREKKEMHRFPSLFWMDKLHSGGEGAKTIYTF